jgi:uncharacterized FlaG/YvyC family protein
MRIPSENYVLASMNAAAAATQAAVDRSTAKAVQEINQSRLLGTDRQLDFSTDPTTRRQVVSIVDTNTRQVLLQTPPEVALEIAKLLKEQQ